MAFILFDVYVGILLFLWSVRVLFDCIALLFSFVVLGGSGFRVGFVVNC